MENNSSISLPREKCMKCGVECDILMSSRTKVFGNCDHKFCQSCFRIENMRFSIGTSRMFKCPCCRTLFYDDILSIEEAILTGEAATLSITYHYNVVHMYNVSGTSL